MLAGKDEQTAIFENICDLYNYFDPSISVQETFISRRAAKEEFYSAIDIPLTGDDADYIRDEYSGILRKQHEQGNNGLVRTKFFTFAIEADSLKMAKSRLARIETDILNHYKIIGAAAWPLSGKREGKRLSKQRFDEKAKLADYELAHKNAYMYWYNKVRKLRVEMPGSEKLAKVESAFEVFKAENVKRKNEVKRGKVPKKEYTDWLFQQQAIIDDLMDS